MNGRLAQLVEHLPYKEGVTGSSPVSPTIHNERCIDVSCSHFEVGD